LQFEKTAEQIVEEILKYEQIDKGKNDFASAMIPAGHYIYQVSEE